MSHVSDSASGLSARIKKEGGRGSAGRVRLQAVPVDEVHVVASIILSGDRDTGAELLRVSFQSVVKLDEEMRRVLCLGLGLILSLGNPGLIQVPV